MTSRGEKIGRIVGHPAKALTRSPSFLIRFDAFRSIFPAGTVSGAPKIKAIEIVGGLEQERRGVYAGAVGRFDFDSNSLDTCIAIRTMTFKDGVAYLQAGVYSETLKFDPPVDAYFSFSCSTDRWRNRL
jgi:anthranilate synthase component 1